MISKFYQRLDNPEKWHKDELAFLPAALEVQETPPSPIGRAIIWTITLLFVLAIIWSIFGRIDIVAIAQGKIIPSDRVKVIQPLEIGIVQEIHITEGQFVTQGQKLVTLDATQTQADSFQISNQLADAIIQEQKQILFLSLLNSSNTAQSIDQRLDTGLTPQLNNLSLPEEVSSNVLAQKIEFQQRLLREEFNEFAARREALQSEYERQLSEKRTAQSTVTRSERTLPIINERVEALETLLADGLVSRERYLELKQNQVELQQDLITQTSRVAELDASIRSIEQQQLTLTAETQRATLEAQQENSRQITALQQELVKANQRNQQLVLTSPINGTVQQLAIHTVGGIVTPAQELMAIVPQESLIEVEAFILNRDIGFVEEGQAAEVKIDTFNFTQYGLIEAEIVDISNDAINDENLGLVYLTRVLLKDSTIQVGNRLVNLSPGMAVTVEIKTGDRRLIQYFLSPLLRFKQESIRER
ncbi:HlyD family type I secretion periplasmic adaptor subunit [Gammaproteobacteria bacterium]|nr:HlyD family type I secretion periplasmic adaptor subunit [Gammaproteobacteria bacterium]